MTKRIEAGKSPWVAVPVGVGQVRGVTVYAPNVLTMILLDVSGSMDGQKLIEARKAVCAYALTACPMGEWVGLMTFSDEAKLIAFPGPDASVVCASAEDMRIEEGTDLMPALESTERLATGFVAVKKLVVVTDGATMRPDGALVVAERMRKEGFFFVTRGIPQDDVR